MCLRWARKHHPRHEHTSGLQHVAVAEKSWWGCTAGVHSSQRGGWESHDRQGKEIHQQKRCSHGSKQRRHGEVPEHDGLNQRDGDGCTSYADTEDATRKTTAIHKPGNYVLQQTRYKRMQRKGMNKTRPCVEHAR